MAHSIQLLAQVQEMARRSFVRATGRTNHHFTPGSEHAQAFEDEYARCEVNHGLLSFLNPAMQRVRPVDGVQP